MRKLFSRQLIEARHEMLSIYEAVDLALHDAVKAYVTDDRKLATKTKKRTLSIDARCANLEAVCYNLIATQSPVASDFRLLQTSIYVDFNLQRMTDKVRQICRATRHMIKADISLPKELVGTVEAEAEAVYQVLGSSLSALVTNDMSMICNLAVEDEPVHAAYEKFFRTFNRMDAGEFGRMNLAQLNFGSYKEYGDLTNRFYNRNLAGGAMLDIGVYALSVMRLFMASQPIEVVSLGNTCETGVDVAGGIVCRNAEQQLGVVGLTLHSKQPKRSIISFDKCYIEVNEYPRADHATIVWTADGHREEVHAGTEAYALCYEMADLEKAVAGDDSKRELLGYASDVMKLMTKLRADWGVVYPEEE